VPSPERVAEVLVVGAGPAGAAAAVHLAREGLDVLVVDKATFPRDKICGDGLTTSALRELDSLGLDPGAVASWIDVDDVLVRSPSGYEVSFPLPRTGGRFGAVARRRDLDAALVDLARAAGATVVEGATLRTATQGPDGVRAEVDGIGQVAATWAIGADGMWSPLRKALGFADPTYRGEWHAFRQYFDDVSPRAARELVVWFEPDLLPGYAWSFPIGGGVANVGFGILRGSSYKVSDMGSVWRELLARPHIRSFLGPDARAESPHRAWPIPARVDRVVLGTGRTLFVGDAAAATDPLTGEGIGQALATGRWAAEAIVSGGGDATTVVDAYTEAVEHDLVVDHHLAEQLARILSHPLGARGAVRVAGLSDWTRRNFARWLFEDYPRALLLTPSRWHRGMFTGPGAYR
jgi:geranylgeranyl reductase family protein